MNEQYQNLHVTNAMILTHTRRRRGGLVPQLTGKRLFHCLERIGNSISPNQIFFRGAVPFP